MCYRHPPILLTLAASCFFALIGSPPTAAQVPPAPVLDHFRCYTVLLGHDPDDAQVQLQDQFDLRLGVTEQVWVGGPVRFCNPVEKTVQGRRDELIVTPIADPNAHLTMYRIAEQTVLPPVSWRVEVRNQFGRQRLAVDEPHILALPTHKMEGDLDFPEDLDHFKCYRAEGRRIRRAARLADQFETAIVTVLEPRLFCNPTRKIDAAGVPTGVQNAAGHLTCYDVSLLLPGGTTVVEDLVIDNQFTGASTGDLEVVTDEDLLCVPSRKVSFRQNRRGGDDDDDDEDDDD